MKFNFYAVTAFLFLTLSARAQTTAFTYQGQLISNSVPVSGAFDFRFKVYNGSSVVVGKWLTNAPVAVTNGLFTVTLDFGTGIFDGSTRTLEIGVRTNGDTSAYLVLAPRQTLTSVPYAIQSLNALNASNAVALTSPLPATNMTGIIPNALLSPNVAVLTNIVVFSTNVTAAYFFGNGAGLAGLNASSISSGTLSDARLSTNVAFYNSNANFLTVTAAVFTGSGRWLTNVPGAFFWVTNAVASTPLLPNMGYIATNDTAPVIFTLPSSPIAGDVYKVASLGAGGWMIKQNANQTIVAGNLSAAVFQSWKAGNSSINNWSAISSSASGTKLVAAVNGGYIWTSANSGVTWTQQNGVNGSGSRYWSSVASSADGTKLVATVGYTVNSANQSGYVYASSDSGVTWAQQNNSGSRKWSSIASSADGTRLVAAENNGQLYVSNSISNWNPNGSPSALWTSVASSASGSNLVAVASGGQIYTSANTGVSWTPRVTGNTNWVAVASSADGSRLIAAADSGSIYISPDSGATWVAQDLTVSDQITSVASSSDGSHLAITSGGSLGTIVASSDSGATWTQLAGAPTGSWSAIASSADGSQFAAAVYGGKLYVSSQSGTTPGVTGYLVGQQHSAIELIYAGNNLFLPLSHEGTIRAY